MLQKDPGRLFAEPLSLQNARLKVKPKLRSPAEKLVEFANPVIQTIGFPEEPAGPLKPALAPDTELSGPSSESRRLLAGRHGELG
jgi:hypothetical protein